MAVREGAVKEYSERYRTILETAARVICERGYEGAGVQDIADACGLTKAGLYHHIRSKEHLLFEIMNYGMDVFEEEVLVYVSHVEDPLERLRQCMARNIRLVTRGWRDLGNSRNELFSMGASISSRRRP